MGLFKKLAGGVKAVGGIATAYHEMAQQAQVAADQAPVTILNPSPQEEIDRQLAAGGLARGVVVRASHAPLSDGERVAKMKVDVRVRSRLAGGALGEVASVKVWTSWQVAALLDPGLEIPIMLNRTTGLATEIPADLLRRELEHRFGEAGPRRPGWGLDL